jgi:hypothetical protein
VTGVPLGLLQRVLAVVDLALLVVLATGALAQAARATAAR